MKNIAAQSLPFIVIWRSWEPKDYRAGHEGVEAVSAASALVQAEEMLEDDEIAVAAYSESQVLRMRDFAARLIATRGKQPQKSYVVFYDTILAGVAPCDRLGEKWLTVAASTFDGAIETAAGKLGTGGYIPFLAYDEEDLEEIAEAMRSTRILGC